jgi:hypothetical protein
MFFLQLKKIRQLTGGLATDIIKDYVLDEAIGNNIRDTMKINTVKISFSKKGFKQGGVDDKFKLDIFQDCAGAIE